MVFVEARNAILHGRGRLTRQQLGVDAGRALTAKLRTVGVPVLLGRLRVDSAAVRACGACAKASILWLDTQLATSSAL
jgi:hypothetical protein